MSVKIKGHRLLPADPQQPRRATCGCGAWCNLITGVGSALILKARSDWHLEHKLNVLHSQGKLDEEEDKPIWADMR
jgi:hypothetical protein